MFREDFGEKLSRSLGQLPKNRWEKMWWIVKGFLGWATIRDGSVCWYSRNYAEKHDFYEIQGGDGIPMHDYLYTCSRCHGKFYI